MAVIPSSTVSSNITGQVAVTNFPASTTGTVTVTNLPTTGQASSAASLPVTMANDQTSMPVYISQAGSGTVRLASNAGVNIGNVAVTSMPALASGSNTIGSVNLNTAGQQVMSSSVPVTIASNQSAVPVTVTGYPTAAAPADSTANPTITKIGAYNQLYNGSTWDRYYNNFIATMGDTGAQTATFNGATQVNLNHRGAKIMVLVSAVSGTLPTLTAQLQISPDAGTTWLNYGPASGALTAAGTILIDIYPTNLSTSGATPATLTTGATQSVFINGSLPRTWRLSYTIGGTTPSFTFTNAYAAYTL